MVNVYIFREDSTTPKGYTEIDARYRGRLIKAGGTLLEVSGSASHSHIGSANSVSTVSSGKYGNFAYAGTKENTTTWVRQILPRLQKHRTSRSSKRFG